MAETPVIQSQPQLAQLELKFKGPLVVGSQVNLFTDLFLLDINSNYEHKRVWVKENVANYYLANGDGRLAINWKKESQKVTMLLFEPLNTYNKDECVYVGSKFYLALQNVPEQTYPIDSPLYWLPITAETLTYRYLFQNTSSVRIYTEVRNPIFEIIIGTIKLEDGLPVIDSVTGLTLLENQEVVDASVILRDDILPDNGIAYDIEFYENDSLSAQVSGYINIK